MSLVMKLRRFWRLLVGFIAVVVVGLTTMIIYQWYQRSQAEKQLREEIARLDAIDPDWTFEKMSALRKNIPKDANGALRVLEIARLLPPDWPSWKKIKLGWPANPLEKQEAESEEDQARRLLNELQTKGDLRSSLPSIAEKLLKRELELVREPLAKTKELAGFPQGRSAIHYEIIWPKTHVADFMAVPRVTNLLEWDSLAQAQLRDANGVAQNALLILMVGRSVGDEFTLIAQLTRTGVTNAAMTEIERALSIGQPSRLTVKKLRDHLKEEQREISDLIFQAARSERALTHRMLMALWEGQISPHDLRPSPICPQSSFEVWKQDFWLTTLRLQHAAFLREFSEELASWQKPLDQANPSLDPVGVQKKPWYRKHIEAVAKVRDLPLRQEAKLRTTIVALATEQFRLEIGRWPNSPDELVPTYMNEFPKDPYCPDPIQWVPRQNGILIYSVGRDGIDDGGFFDRSNPEAPGSDIGLSLLNPVFRGLVPFQ
jgi:hypothetical protein